MKPFLIVFVLVALVAGVAWGQSGLIGVYPDPQGVICSLTDTAPALVIGYVVHKFTAGSTASRFRVRQGGGAQLIYLADQPQSLFVVGDTQNGVTVCYGSCLSSPILLMQIAYFGQGLSATCSYIEVIAHPDAPSGAVEVVDCDDNILVASGWVTPINDDGTCPCYVMAPPEGAASAKDTFPLCDVIPTEQKSWGKIKALYGNE